MFEPLCAALDAAGIAYTHNEPLADHCTFRIGGPADLFVRPETEEQLKQVLADSTAQFLKEK